MKNKETESIEALVESHISHLESLYGVTTRVIKDFNSSGEVDPPSIENRERLINLTKKIQFRIIEFLNNEKDLTPDQVVIYKKWSLNATSIYNEVIALDGDFEDVLIKEKEKTQAQLNKTYKAKQIIKSYNLNDLKP